MVDILIEVLPTLRRQIAISLVLNQTSSMMNLSLIFSRRFPVMNWVAVAAIDMAVTAMTINSRLLRTELIPFVFANALFTPIRGI